MTTVKFLDDYISKLLVTEIVKNIVKGAKPLQDLIQAFVQYKV